MPNRIKLRRGPNAPDPADLEQWELGVRTDNFQLYTKDGSDLIQPIVLSANGVTSSQMARTFKARRITDQTGGVDSTALKVEFGTVDFDTGSDWDAVNYRFQPSVAGYYQLNTAIRVTETSGTAVAASVTFIKNGSDNLASNTEHYTTPGDLNPAVSDIVYFNGTTDYVEVFGTMFGGGFKIDAAADYLNTFSASLVTSEPLTGLENVRVFRAYRSSAQSISADTLTDLEFDQVTFDTGDDFNTVTDRFQPTVAGYYNIAANLGLTPSSASSDGIRVQIRKNGTDVIAAATDRHENVLSTRYVSASAIVYMNGTTDYLQARIYSWGSAGDTVASGTSLEGHLVQSIANSPFPRITKISRGVTNQSVTNDTWTTIDFNVIDIDTAGEAYLTEDGIQPNVAGYYQLNLMVRCNGDTASADGARIQVRKNATETVADGTDKFTDDTGSGVPSCSGVVYLNGTTDYINARVYFFNVSGDVESDSFLTCHLITADNAGAYLPLTGGDISGPIRMANDQEIRFGDVTALYLRYNSTLVKSEIYQSFGGGFDIINAGGQMTIDQQSGALNILNTASGTNNFLIRNSNGGTFTIHQNVSDGTGLLQADDTAGAAHNCIAWGNGSGTEPDVILYHDGKHALRTIDTGIAIGDQDTYTTAYLTHNIDSGVMRINSGTVGNPGAFISMSGPSYVSGAGTVSMTSYNTLSLNVNQNDGTGLLRAYDTSGFQHTCLSWGNGSATEPDVTLYYDGAIKFQTTAIGATVTGQLQANYIELNSEYSSTGPGSPGVGDGFVFLRSTAPNMLMFESDNGEIWEAAGTRHPNEEWFFWVSGTPTFGTSETVLLSQYVTIPTDWNSWDVWIKVNGAISPSSSNTNCRIRLRDGQNTTTGTVLDDVFLEPNPSDDCQFYVAGSQFGTTGTGNQYFSVTGQTGTSTFAAPGVRMEIVAVRLT